MFPRGERLHTRRVAARFDGAPGAGPGVVRAMVSVLLFTALATQLALIAWGDLKGWRIRNAANLGLACTWVFYAALFSSAPAALVHGAFALAMFAAMLVPFRRGWLGGGDVKFLAAAFLWVGPAGALSFCLALLPATLGYLALARARIVPCERVGGLHRVPFGPLGGVALAAALMGPADL